MGMRPKVSHIIGFDCKEGEDKKKMSQFSNHHFEDYFYDAAKDVIISSGEEDKEFVKSILGDTITGEVLYKSESSSINVIGIHPIYHLDESSLYNHEIVWGMVSSGMIGNKPEAIKVPYIDYANLIGKDPKEIVELEGLSVAREMQFYKGTWGRKYPHCSVDTYDADLEFAYQMLKKIGYNLKRENIDRYIIFEWS